MLLAKIRYYGVIVRDNTEDQRTMLVAATNQSV